jgi:hypothetical protein
MESVQTQTEQIQCFMCSNIMRDPAVFDTYGPSFSNVARDVAIWIAMQHHQEAVLPVRAFAKMFGYTDAFLFKRVKPEQMKELKRLGFGPEIKDTIGYTLAKLSVQNLVFPQGYFAVGVEGAEEVKKYSVLNIIKELRSHTSRKGTYYSFLASRTFLANCHKRFQKFDLATYTSLSSDRGNALSAARKMYLHLVWKRKVWDKTKKAPGVKPSFSLFDELIRVAGFERQATSKTSEKAANARAATQLRELLDSLADVPGVEMSAKVEYQEFSENYTVQFSRHSVAE